MLLSLSARLFLSLSLTFVHRIRTRHRCRRRLVGTARSARASSRSSTRDGAPAATIFTDADGTFRLAAAPDGCRLRASLTGFQPASGRLPHRRAGQADARRRAGRRAHRRVRDADRSAGRPGRDRPSPSSTRRRSTRRQEPPLADLLRSAPGTTVVRAGAPGTVTSLFVRAGESNYTKVLLDGIPLNEPGGAFNLSNITTENLERVEFVRGANSALYGSDAMTGVIQLFTRRGDARQARRAGVGFEGGTFSTARGSAGVVGEGRPLRLLRRRRRIHDRQRGAEQSSSATRRSPDPAGARAGPRRDAALRRTGRARQDRHARTDRVRPARSRRVLQASRRRLGHVVRSERRARSTSARPTGSRSRTRRPPTCCSIRPTRRRSKDARRRSSSRISRSTAAPTSGATTRATRSDGTDLDRRAPARTSRRRWSTGTASARR